MASSSASQHLLALLGIDWPIVQAPMAGTSTPEMAAAVANAGGLGSAERLVATLVDELQER